MQCRGDDITNDFYCGLYYLLNTLFCLCENDLSNRRPEERYAPIHTAFCCILYYVVIAMGTLLHTLSIEMYLKNYHNL